MACLVLRYCYSSLIGRRLKCCCCIILQMGGREGRREGREEEGGRGSKESEIEGKGEMTDG